MPKEKKFFLGKKKLSTFPTHGAHFVTCDKDELDERTKKLGLRFADLQEDIFAESRHKILIILQGMDTSGKDGTVKHVFAATNPQGVCVVSFKEPSDFEKAHDYLWRVHKEAPGKGQMTIFNRSHYEDFVVPRVHKTFAPKVIDKRKSDIRNFEKMLTNEGVTIFKFFLHISQDEQAHRLQARLENKNKHWKFSMSDLTERRYWKEYHNAYEEIIHATHTSHAPWMVIPADDKDIRNYLISKILVDRLEKLNPQLPSLDPRILKDLKAEAARLLPKKKPKKKGA